MQTPEGRGVGKRVIFVDNPLRGSVSGHGSILGFGSLEKVKNHCPKWSWIYLGVRLP